MTGNGTTSSGRCLPTDSTLYVDGRRVGTNGGTTQGQNYQGYWRLGGDSSWNGNTYFQGDIDEVAVYPTALNLQTVQQHYTDSGRTLDIQPAPKDSYGAAVYNDSPELYWRLNETSGTVRRRRVRQRRHGCVCRRGHPRGARPARSLAAATRLPRSTAPTGRSGPRRGSTRGRPCTPGTLVQDRYHYHGGKLIGFGDAAEWGKLKQLRPARLHGEVNYGQLTFGVWTGQANTITSHRLLQRQQVALHGRHAGFGRDEAVRRRNPRGGTNPQTSQQAYQGYWRVGGDSDWGGDSAFFAGSIDEVAVYPFVLSATQIQDHLNASSVGTKPGADGGVHVECEWVGCVFDGSGSSRRMARSRAMRGTSVMGRRVRR